MAKKKKEGEAEGNKASGEYKEGALSSFLFGNAGVGKDQTGGLFSAQAKAKVEAVAPLPGFQDRIGKTNDTFHSDGRPRFDHLYVTVMLAVPPKPKKTKKGKDRPARPLKREKDAAAATAAAPTSSERRSSSTTLSVRADAQDGQKKEKQRHNKRPAPEAVSAEDAVGGQGGKKKTMEASSLSEEGKETHGEVGNAKKKAKKAVVSMPEKKKEAIQRAAAQDDDDEDYDDDDPDAQGDGKDSRTVSPRKIGEEEEWVDGCSPRC